MAFTDEGYANGPVGQPRLFETQMMATKTVDKFLGQVQQAAAVLMVLGGKYGGMEGDHDRARDARGEHV